MGRKELLFWAVVLLAFAVAIKVTTGSPWTWPVYFASGWFTGTALGGRGR